MKSYPVDQLRYLVNVGEAKGLRTFCKMNRFGEVSVRPAGRNFIGLLVEISRYRSNMTQQIAAIPRTAPGARGAIGIVQQPLPALFPPTKKKICNSLN